MKLKFLKDHYDQYLLVDSSVDNKSEMTRFINTSKDWQWLHWYADTDNRKHYQHARLPHALFDHLLNKKNAETMWPFVVLYFLGANVANSRIDMGSTQRRKFSLQWIHNPFVPYQEAP